MFVAAPTLLGFVDIVLTKQRENLPRLVMAFCSWLIQLEIIMNKDQVKGRVEEVKGKVKEAAGVILDDKELELKGNVQKNLGKAQSGFGDLKQDIKDEL